MKPIRRSRWYGWSWIISTPIARRPCTRRSRAAEARRIAKRLEFHYTPKHGSWLNMAEIEFSVLSRCCLKRRLADEETLQREVQALVTERNAAQTTINWQFNTQDARSKLHRLYPFDSKID